MNNATYEAIFGHPKVRKTWKHTLSAEKNHERILQMRFCKEVRKMLGGAYEVTFYFNPGGPAVWGETYVKISHDGRPIVEACLSHDFSYMRQWDGRRSGRNHQVSYTRKLDPAAFVMAVMELERREFRPF